MTRLKWGIRDRTPDLQRLWSSSGCVAVVTRTADGWTWRAEVRWQSIPRGTGAAPTLRLARIAAVAYMREQEARVRAERPCCRGYGCVNCLAALPKGRTCRDCLCFARCQGFVGRVGTETACDWIPSVYNGPGGVALNEPTAVPSEGS